jgi:hypothetical protein
MRHLFYYIYMLGKTYNFSYGVRVCSWRKWEGGAGSGSNYIIYVLFNVLLMLC